MYIFTYHSEHIYGILKIYDNEKYKTSAIFMWPWKVMFLEISEKVKEDENIENWKARAEKFLRKSEKKVDSPLSITFGDEPAQEVKNLLKEMNFKWNRFRKEYYGYGAKSEIEEKLNGADFTLEVLN